MPRYIDAEPIINDLKDSIWILERRGATHKAFELQLVVNGLQDAPTADVEPVIHAHWTPIKKRMYACKDNVGEIVTVGFTCSNCGITEDNDWEHCHCGAKMDNGTCSHVYRNLEKKKKMERYIRRARYINAGVAEHLLAAGCEISEVPTEDVAPIVHGHWTLDEQEKAHCSACGIKRDATTQIGWNYCPNCGAKMYGG